jgi:hypothetical protein
MILTTNDKIPRPSAQIRGSRRTCALQLAATIAAYLSGYALSSAQVLADCTSPPQEGSDGYAGYRGMFLASAPLPSGKFSRFHLVTDANPSSACFIFTSEGTGLVGALYPPNADRQFNQGNTRRIFVYAGSAGLGHPACADPPHARPIRACRTGYGWSIGVDSSGTGNYDLTVAFYHDG